MSLCDLHDAELFQAAMKNPQEFMSNIQTLVDAANGDHLRLDLLRRIAYEIDGPFAYKRDFATLPEEELLIRVKKEPGLFLQNLEELIQDSMGSQDRLQMLQKFAVEIDNDRCLEDYKRDFSTLTEEELKVKVQQNPEFFLQNLKELFESVANDKSRLSILTGLVVMVDQDASNTVNNSNNNSNKRKRPRVSGLREYKLRSTACIKRGDAKKLQEVLESNKAFCASAATGLLASTEDNPECRAVVVSVLSRLDSDSTTTTTTTPSSATTTTSFKLNRRQLTSLMAQCEQLARADSSADLQQLLDNNPYLLLSDPARLIYSMPHDSDCQLVVAQNIEKAYNSDKRASISDEIYSRARVVIQFHEEQTKLRTPSPAPMGPPAPRAPPISEQQRNKLAKSIATARRLNHGGSNKGLTRMFSEIKIEKVRKEVLSNSTGAQFEESSPAPPEGLSIPQSMSDALPESSREFSRKLENVPKKEVVCMVQHVENSMRKKGRQASVSRDVEKRRTEALAEVADWVIQAIDSCQKLTFASATDSQMSSDGSLSIPVHERDSVPVQSHLPRLKSRMHKLPVVDPRHSSELLQESGEFLYPNIDPPRIVRFPPCAKGVQCIGKTGGIPGMPPGGCILTRYMTPAEHQHLVVDGGQPNGFAYCILCMRSTISTLATLARSVQGLDAIGVPEQIVQPWTVREGAGGFATEHCINPYGFQIGLVSPFVLYQRSFLRAHRAKEDGRIFVDQSRLFHREPARDPSNIHYKHQGISVSDF